MQPGMLSLRERCIEKKLKKKLTSVSFAFTHTYTLKKLTLLLLFKGRLTKKGLQKCGEGREIY